MKILFVEDMSAARSNLRDEVAAFIRSHPHLSNTPPSIEFLTTEEEFYDWHQAVVEDRKAVLPRLVIFDIMMPFRRLRESDFGPNPRPLPKIPLPMNEAGFRCARRMKDEPRTADVPFIFYTALPSDLIQKSLEQFPGVFHVTKSELSRDLLNSIEQILSNAASGP